MLLIRTLGRLASTDATTPATKSLITLKESCLSRLKQIIDKPQEEFLRINVETGGCSGFSYTFQIEHNNTIDLNDDLVFKKDHYRVVISKEILPFMSGASIEFNESLIKSSFQVINPVAETKCSCGSSFSIDLGKLQKPQQQNNNNTKN